MALNHITHCIVICHQTVLTAATPKHCNTSVNSSSFISLNCGFYISSSCGIDTLIRTVSFCCRIETFTQRSEILTVTVYLKSQREIRTSSLWRSKLYIVTGTKQTLAVPILLFCVQSKLFFCLLSEFQSLTVQSMQFKIQLVFIRILKDLCHLCLSLPMISMQLAFPVIVNISSRKILPCLNFVPLNQ